VTSRTSLIKYNVLFTLEEIKEANDLNKNNAGEARIPTREAVERDSFTEIIYENERELFANYRENLPSAFDNYRE